MASNDLDDIIKQHTPRLQSYVRGRLDNPDDADDIVQDTFYRFLHAITVLNNPVAHVTAWLYRVAHNLIINHGKKHRELHLPAAEAQDDAFMADLQEIMVADSNDSPDMHMLRSMVWDQLNKAIDELPPEQRTAIVLTEVKGLSVKDAASLAGVNTSTFLSRKHYAVLHIRKRLGTLYEELTQN